MVHVPFGKTQLEFELLPGMRGHVVASRSVLGLAALPN